MQKHLFFYFLQLKQLEICCLKLERLRLIKSILLYTGKDANTSDEDSNSDGSGE